MKRRSAIELMELPPRTEKINPTELTSIFGGCYGSKESFVTGVPLWDHCCECCSGKCESDFQTGSTLWDIKHTYNCA